MAFIAWNSKRPIINTLVYALALWTLEKQDQNKETEKICNVRFLNRAEPSHWSSSSSMRIGWSWLDAETIWYTHLYSSSMVRDYRFSRCGKRQSNQATLPHISVRFSLVEIGLVRWSEVADQFRNGTARLTLSQILPLSWIKLTTSQHCCWCCWCLFAVGFDRFYGSMQQSRTTLGI